jgi:preprotein translocase subunit SecG
MSIYNWITIVSMVLMTFLILIQTRGASLGAGLGGGGEVNTERRGTDKTIYQLTIILGFIFSLSLILGIVVPAK